MEEKDQELLSRKWILIPNKETKMRVTEEENLTNCQVPQIHHKIKESSREKDPKG